jgi:hypothetical protein
MQTVDLLLTNLNPATYEKKLPVVIENGHPLGKL